MSYEKNLENFGKNLKDRRTQLNISQRTLGKMTKIAPAAICGYESGETLPTLRVAAKLADALETTVDSLCSDAIAEKPLVDEEIAVASLLFVLNAVEGSAVDKEEGSIKVTLPEENAITRDFWISYSIQKLARENNISRDEVVKILQKTLDEIGEEDAQQDAE